MLPQLEALIVDDEPSNLELATLMLKGQGFVVCQAFDGDEALELCFARHFDVVLLDLWMPRLDGVETIYRLQAHPPTHELPIVCFSADTDRRREALDAGADLFIAKPSRRQDIVDALLQAIARRAPRTTG